MTIALVGVPTPFREGLFYRVSAAQRVHMKVGARVRVPLGKRSVLGIILALDAEVERQDADGWDLREVIEIVDLEPILSQPHLELARYISGYYLAPLYDCLRAMFPADLPGRHNPRLKLTKKGLNLLPENETELYLRNFLHDRQVRSLATICVSLYPSKVSLELVSAWLEKGYLSRASRSSQSSVSPEPVSPEVETTIVLREDQRAALEATCAGLRTRAYAPFLLRGITGSGKTEIYLRLIAENHLSGRGTIILVPEIGLVSAIETELRRRFGTSFESLHSGLSKSQRHIGWGRILTGEATIVLGPRSALFAPIRNLGLIVVDEEHDGSYKQESSPRYNARDIAQVRGRIESAMILLISATPSLETIQNVRRSHYRLVSLKRRAGNGSLPEGILVDLREESSALTPENALLSRRLIAEIERTISAGDQVVILRNRRGYAPILICRACGHRAVCPDCSVAMTTHLRQRRMVCHYCDRSEQLPEYCLECGESSLHLLGAGTERVEERLRELFTNTRVAILDGDVSSHPAELRRVLNEFSSGKSQILVGTQIVAKGHHFPGVTLAAVVAADSYLAFPDFRSAERTYALMTQLIGRSGRGSKCGKFLLQTFYPDHYAIRALMNHRSGEFYQQELSYRKMFLYPPFARMVAVTSSSSRRDCAEKAINEFYQTVVSLDGQCELRIQGPAPSPLERLRGEWRFQLLVRSTSSAALRGAIDASMRTIPRKTQGMLTLDFDPQSLM